MVSSVCYKMFLNKPFVLSVVDGDNLPPHFWQQILYDACWHRIRIKKTLNWKHSSIAKSQVSNFQIDATALSDSLLNADFCFCVSCTTDGLVLSLRWDGTLHKMYIIGVSVVVTIVILFVRRWKSDDKYKIYETRQRLPPPPQWYSPMMSTVTIDWTVWLLCEADFMGFEAGAAQGCRFHLYAMGSKHYS